jgi:Semialdehyde dehydrogenase, NAD binding domain
LLSISIPNMKVVLSGSTGYIGGEVLTQCLNHPSITSVIVLTRRDPGHLAQNPKAKVITVKDFTSYDQLTIDELKTADAAIWCLGTSYGDERIDIEYPLTFINAIKTRPPGSTHFRYIQLGGALTVPPVEAGQKERSLWFYANGRRIRGATEARVLETAEEASQSQFTVYLVKPGAVLPRYGAIIQRCILGDSLSIIINELGAMMVDLAVQGNEQKVFHNLEIVKQGRKLLEKSI